MPASLILYSTEGCHLCEQAKAVIRQYSSDINIKEIDIADDEQLFGLYGERIPVLKRSDSQQELNWPFDLILLAGFLS
ncbi:glutaredoxin family protein [Neptunicella sp. SCSIO 80796]|uniref:glutaredoxin family protein n=1 Tax=Neptunicella plasticusilytica TaxID=3117012 RepID=UPI003A4DE349